MRQLISILIACSLSAVVILPAGAADRYVLERRESDAALGLILGLAAGAIIAMDRHRERRFYREYRHHQREYRPRRWYRERDYRRDRRHRFHREYQGFDRGQRLSAGDYCPYRLYYHEGDGRYYCVR